MRHAAMTKNRATLYMIYGKIAAGKSTLAAELARKERTVLIALDDWLGALFGDQMSTGQDFMHFSKKLESVMGPERRSSWTIPPIQWIAARIRAACLRSQGPRMNCTSWMSPMRCVWRA